MACCMCRNSSGIGFIFLTCLNLCLTLTHWLVTDDGRITSKVNSEFHLRKPEDLIIFIKNENDLKRLKQVKEELLEEKQILEIEREEEKTDLVSKFHTEDSDCLFAGKPLKDMDFHLSTIIPLESLGVSYNDHVDLSSQLPHQFVPPFCAADLPFSMITMEHLEGLVKRDQLKNYPEKDLKKYIFTEWTLDIIGHRIKVSLDKNETSWILLNLAALYWRIKGNSFEAIECLRRALYYSLRHTRSIAFVSLANILHHAGYSNDASIVVTASLSVSGDKRISYFTLGNILASIGKYSSAETCYREALEIQPDFQSAKQRLHALLCERKLQKALENQHDVLKNILEQMEKYQQKQKDYETEENNLLNRLESDEQQLGKHYEFKKKFLGR